MSADAPPVAPVKKSRKKMIIAIVMVVLLGAGGAGAWYFMALRSAAAMAQLEEEEGGDDTTHAAEPEKHDKDKKPIFTPLENFTVNLNDPGGMHIAQIGITFEVEDLNIDIAIKDHLPVVRNRILLLISSKKIEELLTLEGKTLLARQIRAGTAQSIGLDIPMDDGVPEPTPASSHVEGSDTGSPHSAATPTPAKAGKPGSRKKPVVNPVKEVLFSTFIVQ